MGLVWSLARIMISAAVYSLLSCHKIINLSLDRIATTLKYIEFVGNNTICMVVWLYGLVTPIPSSNPLIDQSRALTF